MKIGILTFHCAHNYGAVLQAYAMQEYLIKLGHDCFVVNYKPDYLVDPYKVLDIKKTKELNVKKYMSKVVRQLLTLDIRFKRYDKFEHFINNQLNLRDVDLEKENDIDAFIVGSDQVWNKYICNGFDKYYFGKFSSSKNKKLIAFAASRGFAAITDTDKNNFIDAIKNFTAISVREESFQNFFRTISNKDIPLVLDPTLLAGRDILDKIAEKPNVNDDYILIYQVSENPYTLSIAQRIAKELNCKIISLVAWPSYKRSEILDQTASPEKFLGYIKYAKFVVTTSFHGTALSVLFNKQFFSVSLGNHIDDRSQTLLNSLSLENRVIHDLNFEINNKINYKDVNDKMNSLRQESEIYILNSLS